MLSSLTFTGIPSKAFMQDWVYALANFMIPVTAVVAVYVAMPFFGILMQPVPTNILRNVSVGRFVFLVVPVSFVFMFFEWQSLCR